ncbi:MAG: hypothetical protein CM15mP102_04150 [Flavobacteriales bacterium]|nr:MAG: hypothetical protein CM15mP102_04150 [Flavobacteriales bacterium]
MVGGNLNLNILTAQIKSQLQIGLIQNKKFGDYSVKLDGESFNGEAVYSELRRDTNTWRSFFRYTGISPTFRADNGFIVENDLKRYELWHGFYKYPDKKILRNYRISARYDREYSFSNKLKRSAFEAYFTSLQF